MAARLLVLNPCLHLAGTDYDADMLDVAQRWLARFGRRVTVQQADVCELPFEGQSIRRRDVLCYGAPRRGLEHRAL